jgi:hypothetical protein
LATHSDHVGIRPGDRAATWRSSHGIAPTAPYVAPKRTTDLTPKDADLARARLAAGGWPLAKPERAS